MTIKMRLAKLEASMQPDKPLMEMSTEELEAFICKKLGLPVGTPLTDDMLWKVANMEGVQFSKLTHEETLELLR